MSAAVRGPVAGWQVPFAYVPPAAWHIVLLRSRAVLLQAAVDSTASPASVMIRRALRQSTRVLLKVKRKK
jgi:hypothetical protein